MGLDLYIRRTGGELTTEEYGKEANYLHVARWAYSGFHSFRNRLATEAGLATEPGEDYVGGLTSDQWCSNCGQDGEALPYPDIEEPIEILIGHSDCDGYLLPWQCEVIAPRLRELVGRWPYDDYDRQQGELLAAGMEVAAAECRLLQFG